MDEYTATELAYKNGYDKGYADAVKVFAERLKNIYNHPRYDRPNAHTLVAKLFCYVAQIAKEMVEAERRI